MNRTLTVRKPAEIDRDRLSLRRGFLDVHTPLAHLHELQLPLSEQRALVLSWVKELEAERKEIYPRLGKTSTSRVARKNLCYAVNTKPRMRQRVRTRRTQLNIDRDRYLDCGREIQVLHRLLQEMKPPLPGNTEHG